MIRFLASVAGLTLLASCTAGLPPPVEVPYACPQLPFGSDRQNPGDEYQKAISDRLNADPVISRIMQQDQVHEDLGLELILSRDGSVEFANMLGCARLQDAQSRIYAYASKLNYGAFPPGLIGIRTLVLVRIYSLDPRRIIVTNPAFNLPPQPPPTAAQVAQTYYAMSRAGTRRCRPHFRRSGQPHSRGLGCWVC